MADIDAFLQYLIFYILLPTGIIILFIAWRFEFKVKSFLAWVELIILDWTHKKMEQRKKSLFSKIEAMRFGSGIKKTPEPLVLEILEIGVGGGRNFPYYPKEASVTCVEPSLRHVAAVKESLKAANKKLKLKEFIKGRAEDMNHINDNTFDVVLCTLTLCTVQDPEAVLDEVQRVLKPGGKFFFLEHVASSRNSFGRWLQDKMHGPWAWFAGGCQTNRETWNYFDHSNFSEVAYEHFIGLYLPWLRTWLYGVATK